MMQGLTPVLEVESNPVFNLLDRGSEPRKSVIYAGDKLNQDKYVVPGAWWSPGWDTGHPIEDLPAVPAGSRFRFTVTGLYESTYTSDPPNYLIRKIEAEVVYGGASTSRELNVWAQIVDTRHQTSADRMTFHEWYRIPTGGDLTTLTTAVTANTAGLSNKLDLYTGTKIESNSDLNTFTTPGTYFCVNSATATTLVNSPLTTVGFRLEVSRNGYNTDNYLVQTIQAVSTSVVVTYKRGMSIEGTWGAWTKQAAMTDVPNIVTQSLGGDFDMNTITQTGVYYFASASNIQNAPTSTYGYLHMIVLGVSGFPAQIVFGGRQASAPDSQKIWVRYKTSTSSDTWTDWYSFGHEGTEYTSLACAYGTLTYKCYKTGRIVSLIATIEVTSDVPARADLVTGLPYTNTTGTLNYTPIIGFDNTTGDHLFFEIHRTNNNTDCSLSSRTAITSGASIRINTTYVTA